MSQRGLNMVQLIGNLGRDPEIRYTKTGQAVSNLNLATTDSWKTKTGERQERTEWHKIVLWGPLAELSNNYLQKGSQIYVSGKITTRQWEDKDGGKRYNTEIVADELVMLGSKDNADPHVPRGEEAPF